MQKQDRSTILYLITKSNWGGAGRYVYDLACAVRDQGYAPIVACGGKGLLVTRLTEQQIPTRSIPALERDVSLLKDFRSLLSIIRIVRETHPAIVHVNSSKVGGIGALATRLCSRACIIFTVHGLPQHEDRPWLSKKMIALITWITALLAHHVITVSTNDTEILRAQPFLSKKVHRVQLGIVPQSHDHVSAREIVCRYLSDVPANTRLAEKFWIGTVAELTPNKGHLYALEALITLFKQYPDLVYICVGEGELSETLHLFVHTHHLEDRVFFTGFIPEAAMLYSAFDICLVPSIKEGLPYSILEAMHTGTPIVASAVGGIPDVIRDGISGCLVAPHSPPALVHALTQLIENRAYRTTLGEVAQEEARHQYTISAMVADTCALYRSCAQP